MSASHQTTLRVRYSPVVSFLSTENEYAAPPRRALLAFWVRADPLRIGMHTNCHGRSPAIASAMLLSLSRSNARVKRSFTCPHALASGCHTTAAELLRASAAARKGIVCTGHVLVTDQRGAVVTAGVTRTGACQDVALISKTLPPGDGQLGL